MKDELRNIISGESEVRNGTAIQAAAGYLKRSQGPGKVAKEEKHYKEKEPYFTLKKSFTKIRLKICLCK